MTRNLTIKEIADELKISKQAVWQKIKRNQSDELDNSMIKKGNTVFVDEKGQNIIKSWFSYVDGNERQQNVNADVVTKKANYFEIDDNKKEDKKDKEKPAYSKIDGVDDNGRQQSVNVDDNGRKRNDEENKTEELIFLRNLVKELQEEKKEVYRLFDQQQQLSLQDKKTIQKYEEENKVLQKLIELNKESKKEVESKITEEVFREKIEKKPWWKRWNV